MESTIQSSGHVTHTDMSAGIHPPQNVLHCNMDLKSMSEGISVRPSDQTASTFFYVQAAGIFYCGAKYFTERQDFPSFLIKYSMHGTGHIHYCGQDYEAPAGSAFWIDCMNHQFYHSDETDLWTTAWLHFHGATAAKYYEQFIALNQSPVVKLSGNTLLCTYIRSLIDIYKHQESDLSADILASELIVKIMTEMLMSASSAETPQALQPRFIQDAVELILQNYTQKLTLDDFSRIFSVNKYYFQKLFKRYIGYTPKEFLTLTRINNAKKLLRSQGSSIDQIAEAVGIDNASHFISIFKRHEGMTPKEYRIQEASAK